MPRRRGEGVLRPSAEINVTSLVDVVLTLLVIFMITAPMMQGGVEVQVPRAKTESVPSSEGVIVTVDRTGAIFIAMAFQLWRKPETTPPINLYKYSLLYLALVFISMGVDAAVLG